MKKLFLILMVLSLTSCYVNVSDTVKNPKSETTVELQQLPKDTVAISVDGHTLYVFNADNEVIMVASGHESDSVPIYSVFVILLIIWGIAMCGIIIALVVQ